MRGFKLGRNLGLDQAPSSAHREFLSTNPAGRPEVRFALAVVLISAVFFVVAAPFAKTPLAQVPAFIPIYASALVVCDLVTATLLFSQFSYLRSRTIFVLASGYVFTSFVTLAQSLTFPGVFSPTGLLNSGPQTAAWLYIFWHAGFPIVVIAYTLIRDGGAGAIGTSDRPRGYAWGPILCGVLAVLVIVCALTVVAAAGLQYLPAIIQDNRITAAGRIAISSGWVLSALALFLLWARKQHTVLDVWLMVVMCAWIFDVALAAILNTGRYDLGWYAGRIYGMLAAGLVLVVLLVENGMHYARLVRDISERKRFERALQEKNLELENANLTKDRFLATMSHELRTPLNAIIGFTGTLLMKLPGPLNTDQDKQLRTVQTSAKHLLALINDLLDLAKIDAGKVQLHREPTACRTVIEEAVAALRPSAEAKGLALTFSPVADEVLVQTDRRALSQIVINLVNNAIKFTESGSVRLQVVRRRVDDKEVVEISVADTGIGIREEDQAKLFAAFARLDARNGKSYEGTGLGLHLSQKLAGLLGGSISLRSEYRKGSTFTLRLASE
jgi:polar amino acid transport system substrate-binding protein